MPSTSTTAELKKPFLKRGVIFKKLDWPVVVGIVAMHLGCLLALLPMFFSWSGLVVFGVLMCATAALGITLCYHRLLTHHSFRTPKWFEYCLTLLGCLAWQGGPIQWVGTHRIHHKHSDDEQDPHTPKHGFAWSHMFWCMHKEPQGHRPADAARDLMRDPIMCFINRYFWAPQFLLIPLMYIAGEWLFGAGASWLVWGVFARTVVVYHGTWFVNSAAHTWGYRNFKTGDQSTNLWWVALLGFGEGWHNNHHAHPRSAAHGMRWFELDVTYWIIRVLGWVGLAKSIVLPRPDQLPSSDRGAAGG